MESGEIEVLSLRLVQAFSKLKLIPYEARRFAVHRYLLSISVFLLLTTNVFAAEPLASVLKGQVIAKNPEGLRVVVAEKDGSILDMVETNKDGVFKLDLTVMDTPSETEVMKLNLKVRGKSGAQKSISVANYLNIFSDTVLLRPISLNQ